MIPLLHATNITIKIDNKPIEKGVTIIKEFNNRLKANKFAEYITGQELRLYTASKVLQYCGESVSVFDGAAGSGQLEQYIKPSRFVGVEIQEEACEFLKDNYPNAEVYNQSFFNFDTSEQFGAVVMNPPFSIKFKDLSEQEQKAIQSEFPWKKSGVVDDIFMLKSLKYTKRYGFYIMYPGISYRQTEQKMRDLIGTQLLELNVIENAFDDTNISVLFLVIDKEKTTEICHKEIFDCKKKQTLLVEPESELSWKMPRIEPPQEVIDIDEVESDLDQIVLNNLQNHLRVKRMTIDVFGRPNTMPWFIKELRIIIKEFEAG